MATDPWKNRAKSLRCSMCIWFVEKKKLRAPAMVAESSLSEGIEIRPGKIVIEDSVKQRETELIGIGRCRRHAPTMNGYPVVFTNDWCGDFKLSEEKL